MARKSNGKGCLWLIGAFFLVCIAIAVLVYALCIAAGVGLWFLLRYIWRRLVVESPDSGIVKQGMKLPPIGRKVLAGVVCALVSICLIGAFSSGSTTTSTTNTQPAEQQEQKAEPATTEEEPKDEAKLEDLTASFIDVGQGDSELVQLPDGKVMLIDAGEASAGQTVVDYLKSRGVEKIDYLVATHPHADHIGGMEAVLDVFDVSEVWMPDAAEDTDTYTGFLDAVEAEGSKVEKAKAGETVDDSDAYDVDVLAPADGVQSDDMNDHSAIIRVTYGDTSLLFTGDASAFEIVAANPGEVDILKAAHHGSETGTNAEVLSATHPHFVIMSYAEGNSYGHPDQSVLDAISAAGEKAYSTAANGTIIVTTDGKTLDVEPSKEGTITAGVSTAEKERQEAEAAAAAQAQAEAQAQAQQQQQQQDQNQETVYITPSGSKYHRQGCRTLSRTKNPTPMTKQEAINAGYEACGVCNP